MRASGYKSRHPDVSYVWRSEPFRNCRQSATFLKFFTHKFGLSRKEEKKITLFTSWKKCLCCEWNWIIPKSTTTNPWAETVSNMLGRCITLKARIISWSRHRYRLSYSNQRNYCDIFLRFSARTSLPQRPGAEAAGEVGALLADMRVIWNLCKGIMWEFKYEVERILNCGKRGWERESGGWREVMTYSLWMWWRQEPGDVSSILHPKRGEMELGWSSVKSSPSCAVKPWWPLWPL